MPDWDENISKMAKFANYDVNESLAGEALEQAIIDDFVDGQSRKDIAKKYGVTRYKVNKVLVDPKWKEVLDNEEAAVKREMEAQRGKILELLGELMKDENPSIRARAASIMKTFLGQNKSQQSQANTAAVLARLLGGG